MSLNIHRHGPPRARTASSVSPLISPRCWPRSLPSPWSPQAWTGRPRGLRNAPRRSDRGNARCRSRAALRLIG